ncbi:MAG: hypothetical protein ABIR87_05600 [Sphingomicrobium sp.]
MGKRTSFWLATGIIAAPLAAAEPPLPAWHGLWQGTIGAAPIMLCLDGSNEWKRGSYYYRSRMISIPLRWNDQASRWVEEDEHDKVRATFVFDRVAPARIAGRWSGGGKTPPLTLDRVAIKPGPDDLGPCGSRAFIAPRLAPTPVVERPGTLGGTAFRQLALRIPPSFKSATVESFALIGSSPAIARINRALAKPLADPKTDEGWLGCMQQNLGSYGNDGDYDEELTPTMIGPHFLAANHHNDGSCGGAHPYAGNAARTFDLSSGAEIDLFDWLTARAIKRERYDGTSEEAKMLTPAFRTFVLTGWKAEVKDCQEAFERSDFWDIGLTRTGLGFTPSLAHVEMACTETIAVPFARLQPWLSSAGKAGVTRR